MTMSMTQTMSHPNDWAQFYRQISFSGQVSPSVEATALPAVPDLHRNPVPMAATAVASETATSPVHGSCSSVGAINASGRVAKPRRRRSRASRRTPTTLLSTDTTNFRAMVQQFTGGPGAGHFLSTGGSMPGALNINFGLEPAARAPAGPHVAFHHMQNPLLHHAGQRPVFGAHVQDLPFGNMLSLDGGASPEFPPRPPFMQ